MQQGLLNSCRCMAASRCCLNKSARYCLAGLFKQLSAATLHLQGLPDPAAVVAVVAFKSSASIQQYDETYWPATHDSASDSAVGINSTTGSTGSPLPQIQCGIAMLLVRTGPLKHCLSDCLFKQSCAAALHQSEGGCRLLHLLSLMLDNNAPQWQQNVTHRSATHDNTANRRQYSHRQLGQPSPTNARRHRIAA